jgi:hypothetical protein
LLADDNKPGWLKIDFDRWRGEDDSEDERQQDEITVFLVTVLMLQLCLTQGPIFACCLMKLFMPIRAIINQTIK